MCMYILVNFRFLGDGAQKKSSSSSSSSNSCQVYTSAFWGMEHRRNHHHHHHHQTRAKCTTWVHCARKSPDHIGQYNYCSWKMKSCHWSAHYACALRNCGLTLGSELSLVSISSVRNIIITYAQSHLCIQRAAAAVQRIGAKDRKKETEKSSTP